MQNELSSAKKQQGTCQLKKSPPSKPKPASDITAPSRNDTATEISKLILSNNLEFIRGTLQALQAFTSLVLTAYIALLVGFRKDLGFHDKRTLIVAFAPILCWGASLFLSFLTATRQLQGGSNFTYGDLESTVNAYEQILSDRRKQLLIPGVLCLTGLICFFVAFFVVFLSSLP
jgi:hypothetical protein